jgi:hypothetical protein
MNEMEWLTGTDPAAMLDWLEGKVSDRKLRLFACACARRYWHLLRYPPPRQGIEAAEQFADGLMGPSALEEARGRAELSAGDAPYLEAFAYLAALATTEELALDAARNARESARQMAVREAANEVLPYEDEAQIDAEASAQECRAQCELIRDVFGNPFRPIHLDRYWLDWNGGFIACMARQIYEERRFQELPYLADALMDAGCGNEILLRHLHVPQGHMRGCWVLDLLLGLE